AIKQTHRNSKSPKHSGNRFDLEKAKGTKCFWEILEDRAMVDKLTVAITEQNKSIPDITGFSDSSDSEDELGSPGSPSPTSRGSGAGATPNKDGKADCKTPTAQLSDHHISPVLNALESAEPLPRYRTTYGI